MVARRLGRAGSAVVAVLAVLLLAPVIAPPARAADMPIYNAGALPPLCPTTGTGGAFLYNVCRWADPGYTIESLHSAWVDDDGDSVLTVDLELDFPNENNYVVDWWAVLDDNRALHNPFVNKSPQLAYYPADLIGSEHPVPNTGSQVGWKHCANHEICHLRFREPRWAKPGQPIWLPILVQPYLGHLIGQQPRAWDNEPPSDHWDFGSGSFEHGGGTSTAVYWSGSVPGAPAKPTAAFDWTQKSRDTVHLDASASTGTAPLRYSWNFGKGVAPVETSKPAFDQKLPKGKRSVTLTVTDANGQTARVTREVILTGLVVNSAVDRVDKDPADGVCDTGSKVGGGAAECTLRAAIQTADTGPGNETIGFDIPGAAIPRITLDGTDDGALPPITAKGTVIDGTTQPGGKQVEISRPAAPFKANLTVTAGGCTLRGLVVNGGGDAGLEISGDGTTVTGTVIGLRPGLAPSVPFDQLDADRGIYVHDAKNVRIGGPKPADRVVIGTAPRAEGIMLKRTTGARLDHVRIGSAAALAGNQRAGGATGVAITASTGAVLTGSVVNGNLADENYEVVVAGSSDVTVSSNVIGLTADGTAVAGTSLSRGGIVVADGASTVAVTSNVVGGFSRAGITVEGKRTHRVTITGNTVGVRKDGAALTGKAPTQGIGIVVAAAQDVAVRGNRVGAQIDTSLLVLGSSENRPVPSPAADFDFTLTNPTAARIGVTGNTFGSATVTPKSFDGVVVVGAVKELTFGADNRVSGAVRSSYYLRDTSGITLANLKPATGPAPQHVLHLIRATGITVNNAVIGSATDGAVVASDHSGLTVRGSRIGLDRAGKPLAGGLGVAVATGSKVTLEKSIVAHQSASGTVVDATSTLVARGSPAYDVAKAGIVTASGPKPPSVLAAKGPNGRTWLLVRDVAPGSVVELFTARSCVDGEGGVAARQVTVRAGRNGVALVTKTAATTKGYTATVTTPDGTSPFSAASCLTTTLPDTDRDGVPDAVEKFLLDDSAATDAAVVAFPSDAGDTVTLRGPGGTKFVAAGPIDNPNPGALPAGVAFPAGLLSFRLTGVLPGDTVTVDVNVEGDADAWWRYGPPQPGRPKSWYAFTPDPATGTGAVRTATGWRLTLVDGGRGDDDGIANGQILDPSGPATTSTRPPGPTPSHPRPGPASTPPGAVAATGSPAPNLLGAGLLLLATGVLALALGRRRPPSRSAALTSDG